MNEIENKESWDKKKIVIFFVILALGLFGLKTYALDMNSNSSLSPKQQLEQVKGESSVAPQFKPIDFQEEVEKKLDSIKSEVNNINVTDIATSSPAVQKVLNDIKNLQELPKNQCLNICNSVCVR